MVPKMRKEVSLYFFSNFCPYGRNLVEVPRTVHQVVEERMEAARYLLQMERERRREVEVERWATSHPSIPRDALLEEVESLQRLVKPARVLGFLNLGSRTSSISRASTLARPTRTPIPPRSPSVMSVGELSCVEGVTPQRWCSHR